MTEKSSTQHAASSIPMDSKPWPERTTMSKLELWVNITRYLQFLSSSIIGQRREIFFQDYKQCFEGAGTNPGEKTLEDKFFECEVQKHFSLLHIHSM